MILGIFVLALLCSCRHEDPAPAEPDPPASELEFPKTPTPQFSFPSEYLELCRPVDGFDFPVAPPNAGGYYTYRGIIPGEHYGEDWNDKRGGNSDYGALVYSIADGVVVYARHFRPGWGTVVRIMHNTGTMEEPVYIESLYAHLASNWVKPGNFLKRGDPIGTMGTAENIYHAHLHLELRAKPDMVIPWTEGADTSLFLAPTEFIKKNRPKGLQ